MDSNAFFSPRQEGKKKQKITCSNSPKYFWFSSLGLHSPVLSNELAQKQ